LGCGWHVRPEGEMMDRLFKIVLTGLLLIVAFFQAVQVVTRYVLEIPMMGLEEMLIYPTLWLYVLGSVNASREDSQIRANVLDVFLKTQRARLKLAVTAEVISLGIVAWLTWWGWDFFRYSLRVWKESPTLYVPTFYSDCAVFIGLLLMTLWTVKSLIKHVRVLAAHNPSLDAEVNNG
jgi:TRAP-type C4-dicarboxylate transport system permease small subunit